MGNFCNSRDVVTRKPHRCEWCNGPIPSGEICIRAQGCFDHAMYSYHMHSECWKECLSDPDISIDGFMPGCGEMPERIKALL